MLGAFFYKAVLSRKGKTLLGNGWVAEQGTLFFGERYMTSESQTNKATSGKHVMLKEKSNCSELSQATKKHDVIVLCQSMGSTNE